MTQSILYNYHMVKTLRTRKILEQTDFQNDKAQTCYPIADKLSKNRLKKLICSKFQKEGKKQSGKQAKFFDSLQNGAITQIVDETKYECPICLELMVRPTLMECGHMYCYRCLESNIAHNASCCICRKQQNPGNSIPSVFAQSLINEILAPRSNEIFKYLGRITETSEWIKRRELSNLKPGVVVDFQDAFKVWRRAIILKTFIGKDNKLMINIKSFFKGAEILQSIQARSKRLAPLSFFTRGKYLQDPTPVLPQYDLYQNELEILEYRDNRNQEELFYWRENQGQFPTQPQQNLHQQSNQSSEDQALALFNWQMNRSDLFF